MLPTKKSNLWLPSIFNDFLESDWVQKFITSVPATNVIEREAEYKVEVAAPGLTKEDFIVRIDDNNVLHISVEKKEEKKEEKEDGRFLRRDFSYTEFKQNLQLPENIEKEKIEAKVHNGVLTVIIPKKEIKEDLSKSKIIDIK